MNIYQSLVMCNLFIILPDINCYEANDNIVTLLKIFDQKKTIIIDNSKENQVKMFQKLFQNDIFCSAKDLNGAEDEFVLFEFKDFNNFDDISRLSKNIQKGIMIFSNTNTFEITAKRLTFGIDQEVYLFDKETSVLYEVYEINNVKTKTKLGVVKNTNQFIWSKDVIQK